MIKDPEDLHFNHTFTSTSQFISLRLWIRHLYHTQRLIVRSWLYNPTSTGHCTIACLITFITSHFAESASCIVQFINFVVVWVTKQPLWQTIWPSPSRQRPFKIVISSPPEAAPEEQCAYCNAYIPTNCCLIRMIWSKPHPSWLKLPEKVQPWNGDGVAQQSNIRNLE